MLTKVDKQAIRFNQATGMVLIIIGLVLDQPWLVLLTCVCIAVSLVWPELNPFRVLYRQAFLKTGLLKPLIEDDNPSSHRFAALLAAIVLAVSSLFLLWLNMITLGWVFAIFVAILVALSVFANF